MGLYLWLFRRLPQDSLDMPICGVYQYLHYYGGHTHPTNSYFLSENLIFEVKD